MRSWAAAAGIAVAILNIMMFSGRRRSAGGAGCSASLVYTRIYKLALVIPVISVIGVALAELLKRNRVRKLRHLCRSSATKQAIAREALAELRKPSRHLGRTKQATTPNWWILGGSLVFVVFSLVMGLSRVPYNQEIVFAGSMAIVLFLMAKLVKELPPTARRTLVRTAIVIFVFRALPGPGAGATWWQIDELGFDQQFISVLSLISGALALFGMVLFRRFMAERSITFVVGFLTIVGTVLSLPIIGMYYGLHEWTAGLTSGIVDARFIAVVDTALESPLGQVAMIPMLAWIANSAPTQLKATFFAVMASFTNLALSLSNLGTKYLNQFFTVTREITDPMTGGVTLPADYSELGTLLITITCIGLMLPLLTILATRHQTRQTVRQRLTLSKH